MKETGTYYIPPECHALFLQGEEVLMSSDGTTEEVLFEDWVIEDKY